MKLVKSQSLVAKCSVKNIILAFENFVKLMLVLHAEISTFWVQKFFVASIFTVMPIN